MMKSCAYCGRIHKFGQSCPLRPAKKYKKESTKITRFRNSKQWKHKRIDICERDLYLCQVCIRKLYNTLGREYDGQKVQVHHIVPMVEDWGRRLDDDNLITLCTYHHSMAEDGEIPQEELKRMIPPGC